MLQVKELGKRYGHIQAIQEISFGVAQAEILAILGPSGCGKTTLLRLIAGFEKPDSGTVWINGNEVSTPNRLVPPFKRVISMIFQDLALWPHMTVKDHIRFALGKKNQKNREEKVEKILSEVSLTGFYNRYPHQLSGGERQRLAIARALAPEPAYLLMDEPFTNLDPILKGELENVIMQLKTELNIGILYVTHSIDEAFTLADSMAVMNQGKIEQIGKKEDICANPREGFVKAFLNGVTDYNSM